MHDPAPGVAGWVNHVDAGTTHDLQLKLLAIKVKLPASGGVRNFVDFSVDRKINFSIDDVDRDVVLYRIAELSLSGCQKYEWQYR